MDRLIYNLSTMPDDRRSTISWASMGAGVVIMAFGIFFAHAGFAPDPSPENGFYLEWVPREWYVFTAGQIIALVGSQFLIIGAAFLWVANQPMTWARALGAAWLAFMQLVIWWAIVPSEWLNLTQGPLGWTSQDILFTIPPWIVLNNEISISLAVVKDAVAGTYHIVSLAVVVLVALQIQKWGKVAPPSDTATAAPSPYGRPLRRGDR
ncbi:MAG: hypothetical protein AB1Z55_11545 [Acidimicrobiia bacterium]